MVRYLAVLGQNQKLSLAELLAVYPKIKIMTRSDETVIFESAEKIDLDRLGGTPKLAEVLEAEAPIKDIKKIIIDELRKLGAEQKIFFGLSFYNSDANSANYMRMPRMRNELGKEIKKTLVEQGYKIRWVTSNELALSSVVIKTNKLLTRGYNFDIVFLPHPSSPSARGRIEEGVCVAKTVAVQDFSDYEFRDMRRPCRDLYSGMTPPKLAKIMINLCGQNYQNFLDPFCGSGTFLAEAALLGYKKICGSDVSAKAVSDSQKNIDWLFEKYKLSDTRPPTVKLCDIKNISSCWPASRTDGIKPPLRSGSVAPETSAGRPQKFSAIATEPYLGQPVRGQLAPVQAEKMQKELSGLYEIYLKNLSSVLEKNGTLVLIVPFFFTEAKNFKIILKIKENGLTAVLPSILYSRPDQKVGREIYILKKI